MGLYRDQVDAVLFFEEGQIGREMLYSEFEAVVDGIVPLSDLASQTIQAVFVRIDDRLCVRSAVFFLLGIDDQGHIDRQWNVPLEQLADISSAGPDLGGGVIRLASRKQCPIEWHQRRLWEPDKTHLSLLCQAIKRNRLRLPSSDAQPPPAEPAAALVQASPSSPPSATDLDDSPLNTHSERFLQSQMSQKVRLRLAKRLKGLRWKLGLSEQQYHQAAKEWKQKFHQMSEGYKRKLEKIAQQLQEEKNRFQHYKRSMESKVLKIEAEGKNHIQKLESDKERLEHKLVLEQSSFDHRFQMEKEKFEHSLAAEKQSYQHKLSVARSMEKSQLENFKSSFETEAESRLEAIKETYKATLEAKEKELSQIKTQEKDLKDELTKLKQEKRSLIEAADPLLNKISRSGVNFIAYHQGIGNITVTFSEIMTYLESPTAYAAKHAGLSERLYKDWLDHYKSPRCQALGKHGEACGQKVDRVNSPRDFHPGESDRCSVHQTQARQIFTANHR